MNVNNRWLAKLLWLDANFGSLNNMCAPLSLRRRPPDKGNLSYGCWLSLTKLGNESNKNIHLGDATVLAIVILISNSNNNNSNNDNDNSNGEPLGWLAGGRRGTGAM